MTYGLLTCLYLYAISFSHKEVFCNRFCDKQMRCGHTCNKYCSDTHICVCSCKLAAEIAAAAAIMEANSIPEPAVEPTPQPTHEPVVKPKVSEKERMRRRLISEYHAYANGGAQQHDTILEKASTKQRSKTQKTRKVAIGDLLGEDTPESVSCLKPDSEENIRFRKNGVGEPESRGPSSTPQWSLLD